MDSYCILANKYPILNSSALWG